MVMKILWHAKGWEDFVYWQENDRKKCRRINKILKECMHTPYAGIGHPEQLKYEFQGYWSRRIDSEHRLVYKVSDDTITILQCRYHYTKD